MIGSWFKNEERKQNWKHGAALRSDVIGSMMLPFESLWWSTFVRIPGIDAKKEPNVAFQLTSSMSEGRSVLKTSGDGSSLLVVMDLAFDSGEDFIFFVWGVVTAQKFPAAHKILQSQGCEPTVILFNR